MKSISEIKSARDVNNLSHDELIEVYSTIHAKSNDEWFPIMFVKETCPYCVGEAHQFENYKKEYSEIRCFNGSCEMYGKAIFQYYKGDDYYRMAISMRLKIEE